MKSSQHGASLSAKHSFFFVVVIISFGASFYMQSSTVKRFGFNPGYKQSIFEYITNEGSAELDPITAYVSTMDLSNVPPRGSPPNLQAERATEEETKRVGHIRSKHGYGGGGDKPHLGGFTTIDPQGISPSVWTDMMEYFGVHTLLDVGCGRGLSTSWFYMQGVKVQCVEGSHDAIERSVLPALSEGDGDNVGNSTSKENDPMIIEHDFSLGPWWPEETVDAVWCIELLEHVGRNFARNYLTAFKKAALIFATHSKWGGWHHTEVHDEVWWKSKFEMYGFVYSEQLTHRVRQKARDELKEQVPFPVPETASSTKVYNGAHITTSMMVFINPAVASRPEHAHLLSEPGCFDERKEVGSRNVPCGEETNANSRAVNSQLPLQYKFIPYKQDKHNEWEEYINKTVAEDEALQKGTAGRDNGD